MAVQKKFALGRGLDALISTEEVKTAGSSSINEIELSKISVNPNQPRREFDPVALQELADSIAEIGIIQPITLRQLSEDSYQIIAGERRYRVKVLTKCCLVPDEPYNDDCYNCPDNDGWESTKIWNKHVRNT